MSGEEVGVSKSSAPNGWAEPTSPAHVSSGRKLDSPSAEGLDKRERERILAQEERTDDSTEDSVP